jgi:hypothetical protein
MEYLEFFSPSDEVSVLGERYVVGRFVGGYRTARMDQTHIKRAIWLSLYVLGV